MFKGTMILLSAIFILSEISLRDLKASSFSTSMNYEEKESVEKKYKQ